MNNTFYIKPYKKSTDCVKSPFRYAGGKFYALKYILPFIDCVPHDEYREPFVGGGSVFFAKSKSEINWINDLETDIVNVYKAFADQSISNEIIDRLKNEIATKSRHSEIKEWQPNDFIDKVYRTFYLNRTSYCGIINSPAWGYKDGKSSPPQNWGNFITNVNPKLSDINITSLDFSEVITASPKGKSVLLYLDPPYYKADQKRAYTKSFEISDHIRLAELLKKTPYFFCLSYDNVDEVKELYSWANIYERSWLYNTANVKGMARNLGSELIITNYKVENPPTLFDL